MSAQPTNTRREAYARVQRDGTTDTLRYRVAELLAETPMTTHELAQAIPDHGKNAIRPRVDELLRMGCVMRQGRRENPSGHEAYVHYLTDTGRAYLRGEVDPEPEPTVSQRQREVVAVARAVVRGAADTDVLHLAVDRHDRTKRKVDPEWSPR